MKNNKGISIITLIITIIVIIILAGIAMVASFDPVDNAIKGKNAVKVDEEEKIIKEISILAKNMYNGKIEIEKFKEEFTEAVGPENVAYTIESLPDDEYKITFLDSKNSYILNILTGECLSDGESSGSVGGDVSGGTGEDNGNGNYLIIEDVKIATIGTINPGSTERLDAGTVFSYSGETYYAVAIANSPAYIEDFLNHSCVRINKEKGFTVPSSATVQGDLKKEGENVYVYYPWGDNSNEWGYTYPSYWLKIK